MLFGGLVLWLARLHLLEYRTASRRREKGCDSSFPTAIMPDKGRSLSLICVNSAQRSCVAERTPDESESSSFIHSQSSIHRHQILTSTVRPKYAKSHSRHSNPQLVDGYKIHIERPIHSIPCPSFHRPFNSQVFAKLHVPNGHSS
jgi:hypothetical protein